MGDLSLYDRNRAISIYEDSRELTSEGGLVSKYRYYEEFSTIDSPLARLEDVESNPHYAVRRDAARARTTSVKNDGKFDSLAFMVLMNSMCLFFVMVALVVKVLIG